VQNIILYKKYSVNSIYLGFTAHVKTMNHTCSGCRYIHKNINS